MDDGWLLPRSDNLFRVLHTLDFPPLASHPWLRTCVIVTLSLCGFGFSLTGVVLAWRLSWNNVRGANGRGNSSLASGNG